ncbi:UNKNOWN [Stylonychia lemnae]|uniref:Uncharacterized protein n=1 Tax=Stylonychia lemnae TaxID=5949 RepID=A0A078B7H9_STYLE|nr:UNKNOWN [Stylonychia lemnae]|eukprot:CDW89257.1 UNKNOWN [Stylonychia lemnae]
MMKSFVKIENCFFVSCRRTIRAIKFIYIYIMARISELQSNYKSTHSPSVYGDPNFILNENQIINFSSPTLLMYIPQQFYVLSNKSCYLIYQSFKIIFEIKNGGCFELQKIAQSPLQLKYKFVKAKLSLSNGSQDSIQLETYLVIGSPPFTVRIDILNKVVQIWFCKYNWKLLVWLSYSYTQDLVKIEINKKPVFYLL